ncbi:MAG: N,N-dimethylformamidase beta subunit family domain-containing protein [Acidimicrobiales bacterium]
MGDEVEGGPAEQVPPASTPDPAGSGQSTDTGGVDRSRRRLIGGALAAGGLAAAGVTAALVTRARSDGSGAPPASTPVTEASTSPASIADTRNIIQIENANPGTSDFAVRMEKPWVDLLHAWCDHDSAHRGDTVTIYATTRAATFEAEAFRFGIYGGATGRKVWQAAAPFAGTDQAPPVVDPATNMRSCAHWTPSFSLRIPQDWTPGMYLFRLRAADGGATFVPLTVLDDRRADVLVVSAITTWNAYNTYGGANLYEGDGGRSKVVTFDRPYHESGSGHFFGGEYELVQLVESMGLDVAYTTNIDLHARPEQIEAGGYKVVVSLAHDEYWSVPIRRTLEAARDRGVNLIFLGANAGFRRIRLEPSEHGPHRLEVNYRVAHEDPLFGTGDQQLVTAEWREPPAADPEASLIGNYYESNPVKADMVVVEPDSWVFAGTGLAQGDRFAELVQNEYDRVTPEVPGTPADIEVLCHSPLTCRGRPSFADVTYYTAPSGAGVFATGTLWWERQLGPLCRDDASSHTDECHIRRITANVLEVFAAGPAGLVHPSRSNLAELGITPGYVKDPPGQGD